MRTRACEQRPLAAGRPLHIHHTLQLVCMNVHELAGLGAPDIVAHAQKPGLGREINSIPRLERLFELHGALPGEGFLLCANLLIEHQIMTPQ